MEQFVTTQQPTVSKPVWKGSIEVLSAGDDSPTVKFGISVTYIFFEGNPVVSDVEFTPNRKEGDPPASVMLAVAQDTFYQAMMRSGAALDNGS